jgi:peptidoglycan L-alanyl-D-glutamate endopeptidase CwlK
MSFRLSKSSLARRDGVDPRLIQIDDLAITLTLVDYGHPEFAGLRSAEDQKELHDRGASICDGTILKSLHQTGRALDFYAFVDGKASWDPAHLTMVAAAFLQAASILGYSLEWGGFWLGDNPITKDGISYGWDMPHVELAE